MIVWRIIGSEIGPDGNGAYYFAKKADAERARRGLIGDDPLPDPPERIVVKTREQLASALNEAMGFGAT